MVCRPEHHSTPPSLQQQQHLGDGDSGDVCSALPTIEEFEDSEESSEEEEEEEIMEDAISEPHTPQPLHKVVESPLPKKSRPLKQGLRL